MGAGAGSAGKADALSVQYSSLHALSGYIDVGDAALFQGPWVKPASEKLVRDTAVKAEH